MRKKHNIDEILETGQELLRTQGYNNTGVEEVLKACGIPKGSFYNFFKNKEDFSIQSLDWYGETQYQHVQQILDNNELSPMERLKDFYNSNAKANIEENCANGCLIGNLSLEMGGINDNIAAAADRNMKRILSLISACIREGQKRGEIRDDYPAEDLANYLHNSFYGTLMRTKASKDFSLFELFQRATFDFIKAK